MATTSRSPDHIQKEIEQTRVELAETIDAIADRISPRRAASRGAQAVKAQVTRNHSGHGTSNGHGTSSGHARPPGEAMAGPAKTTTAKTMTVKSLRTDRVLILLGAAAALAGLLVLRRNRD